MLDILLSSNFTIISVNCRNYEILNFMLSIAICSSSVSVVTIYNIVLLKLVFFVHELILDMSSYAFFND